MALTLTAIRYYTQLDPYVYSVDNRPLTDLESRDNQILAELVRRTYVVDVTGAASPTTTQIPAGWSVAVNGTGDYTITHNLNSAAYGAQITVIDAAGGFGDVNTLGVNSIRIVTRTTAGVAAHKRFNLLITGY